MKARKLNSGRYNVVVPFYDDFGKRKQKSFTADTEAKALKMAQDFLDGITCEYNDTVTLKKAMQLYIETREHIIEPTTILNYKQLSASAFRCIHNIRLCDLKAIDIQRAINIDSGRLSPKYIKNAFGLLKSVLKLFEININLTSIKLPKIIKKEKTLPKFETLFNIFKGDDIELAVLLAAWLSLRIGEITGLQFRDVDKDNKILHVRRTIIQTEQGKQIRDSCKTAKSTRDLKLPDYIFNLIEQTPHDKDTDFIMPLTDKAIRSRFKRRINKHGIDMTFHDLRHLNASVMLMLGVPDKYAMERGGWSTDNILKSVYQQTFSSERIKVDQKIDNYFNDIITKTINDP